VFVLDLKIVRWNAHAHPAADAPEGAVASPA
jgi:hypothetical protein